MEFWGIEVKPGASVKCEPGEDNLIHISQSAIGETKEKEAENVPIYVKFNDQKLVLGTLSLEKCAQISHDLVFEKEFELSHGSKNASVYLCGYKSAIPSEEYCSDDDMYELDSEEDLPVDLNGNIKVPGGKPKEDNAVTESKVKMNGETNAEPNVDEDDEYDEDDSEDDSEGSDDDEDMVEADSDDDDDGDEDEDDESSEDEEDTPEKPAANGKKRQAESAAKTPAEKKAKLVTAAGQKTGGDGKRSAHVSTPNPVKKEVKTPAGSEKAKQQTPKSAGSVNCKSCSKSFNSDKAMESHTKAKHGDGK